MRLVTGPDVDEVRSLRFLLCGGVARLTGSSDHPPGLHGEGAASGILIVLVSRAHVVFTEFDYDPDIMPDWYQCTGMPDGVVNTHGPARILPR